MEQLTFDITPAMLALIPVVAAVLQVAKRIEFIGKLKEWLPVISIGVAFGVCYFSGVEEPVLPSILIGLAASGSYDLVKKSGGSGTPA